MIINILNRSKWTVFNVDIWPCILLPYVCATANWCHSRRLSIYVWLQCSPKFNRYDSCHFKFASDLRFIFVYKAHIMKLGYNTVNIPRSGYRWCATDRWHSLILINVRRQREIWGVCLPIVNVLQYCGTYVPGITVTLIMVHIISSISTMYCCNMVFSMNSLMYKLLFMFTLKRKQSHI